MITVTDLTFAYPGRSPILNNLNFTIPSGTHVALMGSNGSGKTTLALLLKGLLNPTSGVITVDGFDTGNEASQHEIMKRVGLVFQNPDNTIVATTVEREIAFGLENLGIQPDEMTVRVNEALVRFDIERYRHTNPSSLSGGEKQRCALAAVMVMHPAHLILDEPTSLLDPSSRKRLFRSIRETAGSDATVIHITPFVEEARLADRVIVLDETAVSMDGSPETVLTASGQFRSCGAPDIDALRGSVSLLNSGDDSETVRSDLRKDVSPSSNPLIMNIEHVSHVYGRGTPYENRALDSVSLSLLQGSSTALLGPSGSGKTTLLEIAAGVTIHTGGTVHLVGDPLRAMAFQFPEDQMFGETVASYVTFGPFNTGVLEAELPGVIDRALDAVGLEPVLFRNRDPLTLSGGEQRRAALAGVLAMNPDILILDEPIAGLDRCGMELILRFLREYVDSGGTLLFSTHDFEVAWRLADHVAVLSGGTVETFGLIEDVFMESEWLKSLRNI